MNLLQLGYLQAFVGASVQVRALASNRALGGV